MGYRGGWTPVGEQRTGSAVELEDKVAVAAHEVDVAPSRVGRADDGAVPGAGAFVEDVEVVAVQVDRVAAVRQVSVSRSVQRGTGR